jgi:prepilin-type N-terminal cleavage/methylation domain-containing protein
MRKNQKGFTLLELMIVVAIVGISLSLFIPMFVGQVSDGDRVGELVKLSNKGYFCKTFEGALKVSEGGGEGEKGVWEFTVLDPAVVAQMKELLGKRVKIHYDQIGFRNPCSGDTSYSAISVTESAK